MSDAGNENILINALRWQAKLDEHARLWDGPSDQICPGCRAFAAAILRGKPAGVALDLACPTIKQARWALDGARELVIRLEGEAGF